MSQQAADTELRNMVKEWEARKSKIDKELEALHIVIRINQERASAIDAGGRRGSTYAQELTDAIRDILLPEHPLHRNTILERVAERGFMWAESSRLIQSVLISALTHASRIAAGACGPLSRNQLQEHLHQTTKTVK